MLWIRCGLQGRGPWSWTVAAHREQPGPGGGDRGGEGVSSVAVEWGPTGRTVPGVRGRERGVAAESVLCGGDGMWPRVSEAGCL